MRGISYLPRSIDRHIEHLLTVAGAVVIEGPRACGKTMTGLHHADTSLAATTLGATERSLATYITATGALFYHCDRRTLRVSCPPRPDSHGGGTRRDSLPLPRFQWVRTRWCPHPPRRPVGGSGSQARSGRCPRCNGAHHRCSQPNRCHRTPSFMAVISGTGSSYTAPSPHGPVVTFPHLALGM